MRSEVNLHKTPGAESAVLASSNTLIGKDGGAAHLEVVHLLVLGRQVALPQGGPPHQRCELRKGKRSDWLPEGGSRRGGFGRGETMRPRARRGAARDGQRGNGTSADI